MPERQTHKDNQSLYHYYFRALLSFAGVGTLATTLQWSDLNLMTLVMMGVLLVFTLVSYYYSQRLSPENLAKYSPWFGYVDAALIGVVLSFTNFNLLPCILFLTAIQFNALLNGGIRKWAGDLLAMILGVLFSFLIHKPTWVFSSTLEITSASLIGISTYYCVYALHTFKRLSSLKQKNELLYNKTQVYKLRAYKLSRYLPPPVWDAINSDRDEALKTTRKCLTVFFSDIKDFSQLSEELEAESLTDILNTYLTEMAKIANHYGGTIDKFIGDAIMVTFGDGHSKGMKGDALSCVAMAVAMKKKMKILQQQWRNQGVGKPLQIRMGINTGYCTAGTFGTVHHLDYTVLGTHVNLASRLESAAKPGEILITYETWSLVKESVMCRDKGNIVAKGFSNPIQVYQVVDFRKNLGKDQTYFEENCEGFSMHLDMEKVRNYDREKVVEALREAAEKLEDKIIA